MLSCDQLELEGQLCVRCDTFCISRGEWPILDLTSLRYFVAVAHAGSLRRASTDLHMSEPPLSRRMRRLEDQLGVILFERSAKGLKLTSAGEELSLRAGEILRRVEQAQESTRLAATGGSGQLSIGFTDDFTFGWLPELLARFVDRYPRVSLMTRCGYSPNLARSVMTGDLDLALVALPLPSDLADLAIRPLAPSFLKLVVGRNHRLAKKEHLFLKDIKDETIITGEIDPASGFYSNLMGMFQRAKITPRLLTGIHPADLQVGVALEKDCVTLVTSDSIAPSLGMVLHDIVDADCIINRAAVWREGALSASATRFLELVAMAEPPRPAPHQ